MSDSGKLLAHWCELEQDVATGGRALTALGSCSGHRGLTHPRLTLEEREK